MTSATSGRGTTYSAIPVHCLTVDVEDYFQVSAFRKSVTMANWECLPGRVERNTRLVLDLFEELGVKATFFVLGWVANKYPNIVRRIVDAGHELGCHSYSHQLIYEMDPLSFRKDTLRAIDSIQQASGQTVTHYRAPSFSITSRSMWALNILLELGITHDSSIFPIRHDLYGMPSAPPRPFVISIGGAHLIEFPPSTVKRLGSRLPVSGGGYTRILPLWYQKSALRMLEKSQVPGMVYLHPWELDPEQPRIRASLRSHFRHYTGLYKTADRIRKLIAEFRFVPMSEALPQQLPVFTLSKGATFQASHGEFVSLARTTYSRNPQEGFTACT
jgi:polysaccharide deacetylase family protein (PEP-CTERM system associated)